MADTLQIQDTDNQVVISLRANPFAKEGGENGYIGSISRQTVTTNALAARIKDGGCGLDEYTVLKSAGHLKKEALRALKRGQAVNLLGLCTMYLAPDGAVSGPSAASQKLTVRFTALPEATGAISGVKISTVVMSTAAPQIEGLARLPGGAPSTEFAAGKAVRLTGRRLRVGGTGSGVFLCPADADGNTGKDEELWTPVPAGLFNTNRPGMLEFFLPDGMAAGSYRILVRTSLGPGRTERKSPLSALSGVITVSRAD